MLRHESQTVDADRKGVTERLPKISPGMILGGDGLV